MRRILIAMLLTTGLLGGSAAASFAAKPDSAFAAPVVSYEKAVNAAGNGCTATFTWTHPTPEKVAAYYVVSSNRILPGPTAPKGKNAVPGTLVSGTTYSIDVLWPENQVYLWVIAKSTTGKWSSWAMRGSADPTPEDC